MIRMISKLENKACAQLNDGDCVMSPGELQTKNGNIMNDERPNDAQT